MALMVESLNVVDRGHARIDGVAESREVVVAHAGIERELVGAVKPFCRKIP